MFNSLLRLLARSWAHLMTGFSMSTAGFVALSCLLPVLTYAALVAMPAFLDRTANDDFLRNLRKNISNSRRPTLIAVGTFLGFWIIELGTSVAGTTYSEHQTLVTTNSQISQQVAAVSKERDDWKAKFEKSEKERRGPRPAEEKKCWFSNHAGFPNSHIEGAVTANATIIHCNYKIEVPFLVQVEFDRDFIPGATTLPDVGGFMSDGQGKNRLVRWNRITSPALLSNQLVIVTVYGTTDQYPRATKAKIETLQ